MIIILLKVILFPHLDLEKPQNLGSSLYFLGSEANMAALGSGEERKWICLSYLPRKEEDTSLGQVRSAVKQSRAVKPWDKVPLSTPMTFYYLCQRH
jgi:hypothetical protein